MLPARPATRTNIDGRPPMRAVSQPRSEVTSYAYNVGDRAPCRLFLGLDHCQEIRPNRHGLPWRQGWCDASRRLPLVIGMLTTLVLCQDVQWGGL